MVKIFKKFIYNHTEKSDICIQETSLFGGFRVYGYIAVRYDMKEDELKIFHFLFNAGLIKRI